MKKMIALILAILMVNLYGCACKAEGCAGNISKTAGNIVCEFQ